MAPKKSSPRTHKRNGLKGGNDLRDIVIPILGATGSGKSTFINVVLGENRVAVGDTQDSCTKELFAVPVDSHKFPRYSWLKNRRLLLVDTPGFDNADFSDLEILEKISDWLGHSYRKNQLVGGVIYFYDISVDRIPNSARQRLVTVNSACGIETLDKVVLVTTKSKLIPESDAEKRETSLRNVHWATMINGGAKVFPFNEDFASAAQLLDAVLGSLGNGTVLQIQREMVEGKKSFSETEAGITGQKQESRWKAILSKILPFKFWQ